MGSIIRARRRSGCAGLLCRQGRDPRVHARLRREAASYGVSGNAIAPGFIDTPLLVNLTAANKQLIAAQTPLGRLGTPAEIASAAVFLRGAGLLVHDRADGVAERRHLHVAVTAGRAGMIPFEVTTIAICAAFAASCGGGGGDGGRAATTVRHGESIQAAVDAASPGDTIEVLPGDYVRPARTGRGASRSR